MKLSEMYEAGKVNIVNLDVMFLCFLNKKALLALA